MGLLKRAKRGSRMGLRVHLGLRAASVVTMAAALSWCVPSLHAAGLMTRSPRPHARTVAQNQQPAPSSTPHTRASGSGTKKKPGSSRASAAAPHEKKAPAESRAHSKSRHHHQPEPEPDDDPIIMKRAERDTGRHHAAPPAEREHQLPPEEAAASAPRGKSHQHGARALATSRERDHEAAPGPEHRKESAEARSTEEPARPARPVRTERAVEEAVGPAPARPAHAFTAHHSAAPAYAQGVARPSEMDDDPQLEIGPALRAESSSPAPIVRAAAAPPPAPIPAAPARVSGFGAEGVTPGGSHRTLARTMAAHRAAHDLPPIAQLSGEEQNEMTDEVVKPMVLPAVYSRGGRVVMPAPLKGSREVLVHQNTMADSEGLERIHDDEQLDNLLAAHQLTRLPESGALHVNPDLPENRRYARPWTVKFADDLAHAYAAQFGVPLQVNSAVRTVTYQLKLMRVNGNAAAIDGDTASPHLTGQAIDIGKRGMSKAQLAWMRSYLLPLMQAGKLDVEEEFQQACFHVSVYRSYAPAVRHRPKTEFAQVIRDTRQAAAPIERREAAPTTDDDPDQ